MKKITGEQISEILEIIRGVRPKLLPHFGGIEFQEKTNHRDLVTKYDVDIETYLKEKFSKIIPDVGFVGEETEGDRNQESFWLVDPIDGTGHFIRGIQHCSTMVSLIQREEVVFCVIYDFVNNHLYHAQRGKGSFKDGFPISVSKRSIKESIFGWEVSKSNSTGKSLWNYLENNFAYYNTLCAGMPFALVAEGKIDGLVFNDPHGNDYDFAAGSLLVSEAGGFVQNFNKDSYTYNNQDFIACNNEIGLEVFSRVEQILNH